MLDSALFELSSNLNIRIEPIADGLPVMLIDDVYARPDEVRAAALRLNFVAPSDPYPGRIAKLAEPDGSLEAFLDCVFVMVRRDYLPRLDALRRMPFLSRLHTDFAIVDRHPEELTNQQRIPHTDPVPIFGLVYLNREERGGTLFFRRRGDQLPTPASPGYLTESRDGFELAGRIEPHFNRLAIYPGFIPHSGEIAGDWIRSRERHLSPRLTQRLMFG